MGNVDSEEPFPVTHWWRCNKVICVILRVVFSFYAALSFV